MAGLFTHRPISSEPPGPGDYVKAKYDAAFGAVADGTRKQAFRFFASSFGKGVLAVAVIAIAAMAIATGGAAAAGAVPVINSLGFVTAATPLQGALIGIGQAFSFLMSGAGLLAMAGGGVVGVIADKNRNTGMSVEEARAMAAQYKKNREACLEPELESPSQVMENAGKEQAAMHHEDKESSFCARESRRRAMTQEAGCQLG